MEDAAALFVAGGCGFGKERAERRVKYKGEMDRVKCGGGGANTGYSVNVRRTLCERAQDSL